MTLLCILGRLISPKLFFIMINDLISVLTRSDLLQFPANFSFPCYLYDIDNEKRHWGWSWQYQSLVSRLEFQPFWNQNCGVDFHLETYSPVVSDSLKEGYSVDSSECHEATCCRVWLQGDVWTSHRWARFSSACLLLIGVDNPSRSASCTEPCVA